jgi:hypothetical protein
MPRWRPPEFIPIYRNFHRLRAWQGRDIWYGDGRAEGVKLQVIATEVDLYRLPVG